MNRLLSPVSLLVTVLMPFFIILTSLYVFMTPAFVQYEYSRPDFPASERFSAEARYFNSTQTVRYVWGQISLSDLRNLGVYNEREIRHLVDVQRVASSVLAFHAVSGVLILLGLIILARSPLTRPLAARALVGGSILTIFVIVGIGLFSLLNFDTFFVIFHRIFFEGDSWLFNYTDSLIQFYPEPFWETISTAIAVFVAALSLAVGLAGWLWPGYLLRGQESGLPRGSPRAAHRDHL